MIRYLLIFLLFTSSAFALENDPVLVPGSTEITTLGTINTGTWEATIVETPYGGTGQETYTDGQLLIGDGGNDTLQKGKIPTTASITVTNGPGTIQLDVDPSGVDHGGLAGLADDDHPGYLWGLGRTGDQTLIGSIDSGGSLTLQSTSHGTKGLIKFGAAGNSAYDEVNDRLGIGIINPQYDLSIFGNGHASVIEMQTTQSFGRTCQFVNNGADIIVEASSASMTYNVNLRSGFGTTSSDSAYTATFDQLTIAHHPVVFRDFSDNILFHFDKTGKLAINHDTPLATAHFIPDAITTIGQIIQLAPSQSADAFQVQDSSLNILASIDKEGGILTKGGRIKKTTRVTTTPYTVLTTDHVIYCDSDAVARELDLPAGIDGQTYRIINVGTSGNDCDIDPNGAEQLFGDGAGVAFSLHDSERVIITFETTENWH